MKWLWALGSLILCSTANAQSLLVVQSATINDLYGNTIVAKMLTDESDGQIDVFNARQFAQDTSSYSRSNLATVLKSVIAQRKPALVVFLGESALDVGMPASHSSVLFGTETFNTAAVIAASAYNTKWDPIYIISDHSSLGILRLVDLQKQLGDRKTEVYDVDTVIEYRTVLQQLQAEPKGTIVLNVFSLRDEWNEIVGYGEIEKLLVQANKRHIDVGICRTGFKTTFALGPTPAEAASIAMSTYDQPFKSHISSCANLTRLKSRWLQVYRASMGKFDIVEGG